MKPKTLGALVAEEISGVAMARKRRKVNAGIKSKLEEKIARMKRRKEQSNGTAD